MRAVLFSCDYSWFAQFKQCWALCAVSSQSSNTWLFYSLFYISQSHRLKHTPIHDLLLHTHIHNHILQQFRSLQKKQQGAWNSLTFFTQTHTILIPGLDWSLSLKQVRFLVCGERSLITLMCCDRPSRWRCWVRAQSTDTAGAACAAPSNQSRWLCSLCNSRNLATVGGPPLTICSSRTF